MVRGSKVDSQSAGGSQNRSGVASRNRRVAERERAGRAQRGAGTTGGYRHERAGAEGRGQQRSEELAALQQITSAIQSSLQPGPILQQMADGIVHLLDYDAAVIFLLNGTEQVFRASAVCSRGHILPRINALLGASLDTLKVPARGDYNQTVANTLAQQMTVKHSLYELARPRLDRRLCSSVQEVLGSRTFLTIPLLAKGEVVGSILASTRRGELAKCDEEVLTTLANQAAIAIENARLFQQVEHAKTEWEATFDAIQDPVMVISRDHEILRANTAVAKLSGMGIRQIPGWSYHPGRRCHHLLHGLDQPIEGCPMTECLRTGRPASAEMEDASRRSWHRWVYPIFDDEGRVQSVVEYSRDVTDWKQAQARLLQAEKLSTLGEIIAEVAHEISSPLTIILGYAQLLQSALVGHEAVSDLQVVERAGRRCQRIVEDLLTFSRKHEPQREYADVNQVLREATAMREYQLHVRNIKLSLDLQPDLPPTMADPHQLQQVFLNLINNAEQAMVEAHERGSLRVRSRVLHNGSDSGYTPHTGNREPSEGVSDSIRIEFRDDGPGIPLDIISRIFDPFFSTKADGEGTGLGLSICYGIVEEHGGRIWAESPPNQGATFVIELPVVSSDAQEGSPAMSPPPLTIDDSLSARVLVVDDESWLVRLLQSGLRGCGLSVDVAYDGQQALDKIHDRDYDVILCDIKMPGLTGRELYARLQEASPRCAEQFVFITGDAAAEDTRTFLAETGRPWLSKPFTLDQVEKTMRTVLLGDLA
jgi:two-component system NtrC family sensor kinase